MLIGVVMGRHAGFLTASSSLARKYFDEGPHLIYLPERPFSTEKFLAEVDRVYKEHGLCTVAVSEGIQDEHGTAIAQTLSTSVERDAHGNIQLSGTGIVGDLLADQVKRKLKIKRVRADTFGYLQDRFSGLSLTGMRTKLAKSVRSLCNTPCGTTWMAPWLFDGRC